MFHVDVKFHVTVVEITIGYHLGGETFQSVLLWNVSLQGERPIVISTTALVHESWCEHFETYPFCHKKMYVSKRSPLKCKNRIYRNFHDNKIVSYSCKRSQIFQKKHLILLTPKHPQFMKLFRWKVSKNWRQSSRTFVMIHGKKACFKTSTSWNMSFSRGSSHLW